MPATQDCELSEEAFLGFQNCFCNSDLAFFPHFFFKGVDMLYTLPILFVTHLYLAMINDVRCSPQHEDSLLPATMTNHNSIVWKRKNKKHRNGHVLISPALRGWDRGFHGRACREEEARGTDNNTHIPCPRRGSHMGQSIEKVKPQKLWSS